METKIINVSKITVPKNGTRTEFNEVAIANLAASIDKLGMLNPIVVVAKGKKFEIIAGRNRLEAVKLLKHTEVTCTVSVEVGADTKLDMEIAENLQRDQLSLPDEIDLVRRFEGDSLPAIAQRLTKTTAWVQERAKMLVIPDEVLQACRDGFVRPSHLAMFADVDPEKAIKMVAEAREKNQRVDGGDVENATNFERISHGDFDPLDEALNASGSCVTCPFNTSCSSLFPSVDDGYCTNSTCYEEKEQLTVAAELAEYSKDYGITMIHKRYTDDEDTLEELGVIVDVVRNIHSIDLEYGLKPTDTTTKYLSREREWVDDAGDGYAGWLETETWQECMARTKEKLGDQFNYFFMFHDGGIGYYVKPVNQSSSSTATTKASGEEVVVNTAYISDEDSNKISDNIAEIEKKQENYIKWEDNIMERENKWFADLYQEWLSNVKLMALDKADDKPDFELIVTGEDAPIVKAFLDTIVLQGKSGWDDKTKQTINSAIIQYLKSNLHLDTDSRKKLFTKYNAGVIKEYRKDIRAKKKKREGNMNEACEKMQAEIDAIRKLAFEKEELDKESEA